jgi:hypothetical protein
MVSRCTTTRHIIESENQDCTFPSFRDYTDSDTTVDTIQREDILDTVSNPFGQLIINGGIILKNNYYFQEEFFRVSCIPNIFIIHKLMEFDTPPDYGCISCGRFFHCNKLVILQALRNHPENIWIDKPSHPISKP